MGKLLPHINSLGLFLISYFKCHQYHQHLFELLKLDLHFASQISNTPFAATISQSCLCLIMNMNQTELHLNAACFKTKGNSPQCMRGINEPLTIALHY